MPTPFNHIVLAESVRQDPDLPRTIRQHLEEHRPAFTLGNTAPDFGAFTGRARDATHFFSVPLRSRRPAHLRLLDQHGELGVPEGLPPGQSAFVAGYLAHLWLDQVWIATIFEPYFAQAATSADFHQHLVAHNLLRAHLDRVDRPRLSPEMGDQLRSAEPDRWLPFAPDEDLMAWRDHLAQQLEPGGKKKTVDVFARRLGVEPTEFRRLLESPDAMQEQVFSRLPAKLLHRFWAFAHEATLELVKYYLEGRPTEAPLSSADLPQELPPLAARSGKQHEGYRTI